MLTGYIKGTPVHVKSAINYNDLLTMNKITDIEPISDGEKVKWAYLVNNPYGFDSFSITRLSRSNIHRRICCKIYRSQQNV